MCSKLDVCSPEERRRQWQPIPVLLPGKSNGWRSLVGYRPWGREELDTTELLHFHFSLSCIGEGNGNPLQCSCLENPRYGGTWWAAICGVAQSRTRLKQQQQQQQLFLVLPKLSLVGSFSHSSEKQFQSSWDNSTSAPIIYHCVTNHPKLSDFPH